VRRSLWLRSLRRPYAAARLLGLRVRIPPDAWMSVCCEFCFFFQENVSPTGWSLVQRSSAECGVFEGDREASIMRQSWATKCCCTTENKNITCSWLLTYLLTYLVTYSMVQSPSWEASWFAASQEIPRISQNPKVHYRTHKRSPPVSILGLPNPVHKTTYVVVSISFRPDQLWKVTEMKQLCYFSI